MEAKRDALLDAACGVFARFGFRKTSMDEVARAAGVSRQGLYLQFADKEALFRKAVEHRLTHQLRAAQDVLAGPQSLELRLTAACDEWAGRHVGTLGADAADLMCASTTLAGATLTLCEQQFEQALADAIDRSALREYCERASLTPAQLARTLHATARGLKQCCRSRQEFLAGMAVAARMFCAPMDDRDPTHGVTI